MCDCDADMPDNVRFYLTKIQGLIGRCPEIPKECGDRLIKQLEAKLVEPAKTESKSKKPKSNGSKGIKLVKD